jgi:hypothetical protein
MKRGGGVKVGGGGQLYAPDALIPVKYPPYPLHPLDRRLCGPQSSSVRVGKEHALEILSEAALIN